MSMSNGSAAEVRVELYGLARARAGVESLTVSAGTLADVLAEVSRRCPGLGPLLTPAGRIEPTYLVSIAGDPFVTEPDGVVTDGRPVLILSADAGG